MLSFLFLGCRKNPYHKKMSFLGIFLTLKTDPSKKCRFCYGKCSENTKYSKYFVTINVFHGKAKMPNERLFYMVV